MSKSFVGGRLGSRKSQSAQAPLCNFLPPHFASPNMVLLRKPIFGLAKRQLPRALDDIKMRLFRHYIWRNYEPGKVKNIHHIAFLAFHDVNECYHKGIYGAFLDINLIGKDSIIL